MNLKMRLIMGYAVLAVAASVILGIIYNNYIAQKYKASIHNNMQFLATEMINRFDNTQNIMEQVAEFILSDQDTLAAIRALSTDMEAPVNTTGTVSDISNNKALVGRSINTAYNRDNFYRVLVFNQYGYIASSANAKERLVDTEKIIEEITWLDQVKGTKGRYVTLGVHEDDWGVRQPPEMLYSVVKEIQGNNLGFIEIQCKKKALDEIFSITQRNVKVIAVRSEDGQVIYTSDGINQGQYLDYFERDNGIYEEVNKVSGESELIVLGSSNGSDVRVMMIEEWKDAAEAIAQGNAMTSAIVITFLLFSIAFIIFMAHMLTGPIRQLREKMEHTELSNIDQKIEINSSDTDIKALTMAYTDLLERLRGAITQERKLAVLQLQAQFDTLQAQINPHFMYNVLNVISSRGIQGDDEVICEMCGNLAAMLRYSTNIKERYATIGEELAYLKNYVYLLEARYENRLYVEYEVEAEIKDEILPKITLQQLVENSIEHGYTKGACDMEIKVKAYRWELGWYVEVTDNGSGISEEARAKLQEKMDAIRTRVSEHREMLAMEIGGMGLANTYGRLYLLYQEDLIFEIRSHESGTGTFARIGVRKVGE